MSGCANFPKGGPTRADDPLLGTNIAPVNATPLAINPANTTAPATALPPLTQATPTSAAALASGAYPPLVGGNDLRIGPSPSNAGGNRIQPPHMNPPGVLAVITADNGSKDKGVMPLDSSGNRPVSPIFSPASTAPNAGVATGIDAALIALSVYNPRWTKLENGGPGNWRFSCSIPDRAEPSKSRTYEAEGTSASAAIQSVLERLR